MANLLGIPHAAMVSLTDLVDKCAEIKPGMDVLILAQRDGLYGGVNLVDEEAIAWTAAVVESRGANPTIVWFDEPNITHKWRYPPIVKGAVGGSDLVLNFSSTLTNEEIEAIARLLVDQVIARLSERGIHLQMDASAIRHIAEAGYDTQYGARPLRRAIQRMVEDALSEQILMGNIRMGDHVSATEKGGEIVFTAVGRANEAESVEEPVKQS